jgi:hypothetical protein
MNISDSLKGWVISVEQESGREVSGADWDAFSIKHRLVAVLGRGWSYSAEHPDVGIVFESAKAVFGGWPEGTADTAALAFAFLERFGGTMTVSPLMAAAVRDECLRR